MLKCDGAQVGTRWRDSDGDLRLAEVPFEGPQIIRSQRKLLERLANDRSTHAEALGDVMDVTESIGPVFLDA